MAGSAGTYIGRAPVYGAFQSQNFNSATNGSQTVFTLQTSVSNSESIVVVVSGVVQEPGAGKAYVANGTTLTLSEAPGANETMYVIYLGEKLVTPFGDVTNLSDVTISSIASGEILKWNGSAWINNTLAEAGIAPVASPDFTTAVNLLARGELRFQDAAGGQYVGFEAPATVSSNVMWVLPAADGSNGQMLSTNGSGTLAWATVSSTSLTDADNNTKVQVEESADENKIRFDTAGTERMIIAADGKVGIGNNAPDSESLLDLGSGENSGYTRKLNITNTGNSRAGLGALSNIFRMYYADDQSIQWGTVSRDGNFTFAEKMRLASDGKVGIGISSPSQPLHIKHPSGGTYLRLEDGSSSYKYDLGVENGQGNAFVLNDANANAIRMVVKTDGKVGIGETAPLAHVHIKTGDTGLSSLNTGADKLFLESATGANCGMTIASGNGTSGYLVFADQDSNFRGVVQYDHSVPAMRFHTEGSERMRIDASGNFLFNKTDINASGSGVALRTNDGHQFYRGGDGAAIAFFRSQSQVGSISVTSSNTAYNTSSDYRLKENIVPLDGAIDRIKQLNPYRFNFIKDGPSRVVDGFVAHEVSGIVPEAVTGEKDAMRTEEYTITPAVKNETGNITTEAVMGEREVPDYQGIDQAKLVPLTIAALQEALAKIETLEAKVAALEAQ